MKKIISKLKGKKVLSFVLAAIMLATTFNIALPMLKLDASAAVNIGGISQERVVSDYDTKYAQYAKDFLTTAEGISCGEPTDIVIPGLRAADDFIVQGLSYYPVKDWIMVSVYHKTAAKPSMIFALSAKTGVFEGAFAIYNKAGISSPNYDHGGGLAFSEYNFYYSGDDSDKEDGDGDGNADQIAYAPLSYFNNPVDSNGDGFYEVFLQGAIDLPEMNNAPTAYVCYDEGILWAGNFYSDGTGAGDYSSNVIPVFTDANGNEIGNTMIYGYKLAGNSSEEEWNYLCGKYNNLLEVATASGTGESSGSTLTWNAYKKSDSVNIYGNITAPTAYVGEYTPNFGSVILTEGVNYTIEFTSTNRSTDMYMFAPNSGGHSNVKQSSQTTITQLEDGRYHYSMNFTAGLRPAGADSSWPTTQSTNGTYTGTYTVRFDQDAINAGESRKFEITDIRIYQTNNHSTKRVFNVGSAGYPSYCIAIDCDFEDVQYAIVDKGRIYLSRSWGTGKNDEWVANNIIGGVAGLEDFSTLTIGDIDLSVPGDVQITHNTGDANGTRTTRAYLVTHNNTTSYDLMPMSEGLCFIEDNLYISFEGASNKYMNEYKWALNLNGDITKTGNCDYPIDVVWKLDPYALRSEKRPNTDKTDYYEKITSLSQIQTGDEFIIVHESEEEDPVTQMPILYAFDADGGFKDYNLAKSVSGSVKGYDGMVCHPLTKYSREGNRIYLTEPETDDRESIRWKLDKIADNNYNIENTELYFSTYKNLYFNANTISMMPDNASELANIKIYELGNGGFRFEGSGCRLWCNDSLTNNYTPKINRYYAENGGTHPMYSGLSEKKGTVHCNALFAGNSNIIGGPVGTDADSVFHIYKRVLDQYAEQQESRVFTDMNAVVESDGTYTVNLETYAISSTQYKMLDERPTDFIIVMDASSSMENNSDTGMTGWKRYSSLNSLSLQSAAGTTAGKDDNGGSYTGNIYYRHSDGEYCRMSVIVSEKGNEKEDWWELNKYYKDVWLYYTHPDGTKYWLQNGNWVASASQPSAYSSRAYGNSDGARNSAIIYTGPHYEQTTLTRLDAMKLSVESLIDKIVTEAKTSGLKHRVSIVQYGSGSDESYYNTGLYNINTDLNTDFVQYSGSGTISDTDYASTFFDVTNSESVAILKNQVLERVESPTSKDADTFANHGFEMAKNIISNSDSSYSATGDRSACVLMITDGVPGKGGSDSDSANTVANDAIEQAKTIKDAGGYVFTAQLGSNSMDGFDMDKYMDYTSSEYVSATSLEEPGDRNIKDIEYRKDFALGGSFNLENFVSTMFDAIQANSRFALVQLDGKSVIQQKLSSLFDASTAETPTAVVQDGYYDKIGRLTFDNIQTDTDIDSKMSTDTITVSGFDYSTEYISKEKPGKKLIVTVKGLIPKPNVDFVNESINNHTYTAIYQKPEDVGATSAAKDLAFKHFPTEYFNIPEYTYVLDYGLSLLDTDVNGTLCSVSDRISKQSTYNKSALEGDLKIQEGDQNLIYNVNPDAFTAFTAQQIAEGKAERSGYTLIERPDGTYDWFKIKVVPASNIYYEETSFAVTNGLNPNWEEETDGTSVTYRDLPEEGDVDGFDNAYDNNNKYSNGTILSTTVSSSQKRSDTASVTFTGNGFDLVSACGPNTGVQLVAIKKDGKTIKSYIVDTYYDGELVSESNPLVSQVPIVNWRTDTFGKYTVETKGYYLSNAGALTKSNIVNKLVNIGLVKKSADLEASVDVEKILAKEGMDSENVEVIWFDDNSVLNGGTGAKALNKTSRSGSSTSGLKTYIDGFRIYNPLGDDSSNYAESEKNASYVNVIENLAPVGDGKDTLDGIGFISGTLENGVNLSFSNYESVGPQGEFYLKANQAVTFKVKVNPGDKVMLGLRAVNGATTINVNNVKNIEIKSATEMFYDISNCIGTVGNVGTEVQVTIQNGSGILALNQVKFSGGANVNTGNTPAARSRARTVNANTPVSEDIFLPLTQEDLIEVENIFTTKKAVDGIVENGVIIPVEEEIPENNTNTDNDNTNTDNDNTNPDNENTNDGTDTEGSEEEFNVLSLIQMIIKLIEKILKSAFGAGSIA